MLLTQSRLPSTRFRSLSLKEPIGAKPEFRPSPRLASSARNEFVVASDQKLQRRAFQLVYRSYITAGLIEPNPYEMRVTNYHLSNSTNVFVGMVDDVVVNTVSLVGDSHLGLPMESIFPNEVRVNRVQGKRIAEVSCMAAKPSSHCGRRAAWNAFVGLNRLMAQFARFHGYDQLMIATHPRHAKTYERLMGFKRLGDITEYPSVRNNPAVACYLDFDYVDQCPPPLYEEIFGTPIAGHNLKWRPVAPEDYHRFQPAADAAKQFVLLPAACG